MNAGETIVNDLNKESLDYIEKGLQSFIEFQETFRDLCKDITRVINEYTATGRLPAFDHLTDFEEYKKLRSRISNEEGSVSSKENHEPDDIPTTKKKARRSRRTAFKEATQSISGLNERRHRTTLKKEKISMISGEESVPEKISVKTELEEMPAPTRPAPKKRRKNTTSKQIKQEKIEDPLENPRESDVIIEEAVVPLVNLVDSLEEETNKTEVESSKRTRTASDDGQMENKEKRPKSSEDETQFEDAVSTVLSENADKNNATFVTASKLEVQGGNLNSTVVVQDPKYLKSLIPKTVDDLMTDDESEEEKETLKKSKVQGTIPKRAKQIFSPFEQSPVKKKVQAFEKLQEEAAAMPVRITRTKTRNQAKEQDSAAEEPNQTEKVKSNVKEKAKIFTPVVSKFLPKAASTTVKNKNLKNSSSTENLMIKSASALKASHAEYREIEMRRHEKEQEALKKREAMLQAQSEEKRRKREEKQLKAQQQREMIEKEKQKALEAQRLKEERHRQHIAEQEEKKLKLKEELEKKRLIVKNRAIEQKKYEEEQKREEERKAAELAAKLAKQDEDITKMLQKQKERKAPIYMREPAPPLPSDDCHDSDSEEYKNQKVILKNWEKEVNVMLMQKYESAIGHAIKNTFFSLQARTPDLQEILEHIEPRKLKRTSSALWDQPPRFTMIPGLETHDETEEFI
ncbi:uncharacterized protein LOC103314322 [Tribolium castaneum]|uniref:Inner centromere protein ARK-binding domain-containing protein n=1 Tax=Tribolium castaneum TaxID=7070 RepID=D6WTN5_TRICA|nr:PREDICTED: stress response protein NST1 [Tribolium castaneum]EFA07203.1 hypothetical protein TcasGA2_TC010210 [Tribolium castaneum]|eukprot:XP_008198268.1 PREDICTED: stress response protein NST1 [Tribolium castaneum]